jgi:predicted acylesterase/phospholipase RssA
MMQALSIMGRSTVSYLYQDADVVIIPKIGHIRPDDLSRAPEMITAGEEATERLIRKITALMRAERIGLIRRFFGREIDERRVTRLR